MKKMNWKWTLAFAVALVGAALLLDALAWAKPPKPPPPPPPPPVTYHITWLDTFAGGSYTEGMNNLGHVVGEAYTDFYQGNRIAFLYTPEGGMIDLNTLIPEGTGWVLRQGNAINDLGAIVGSGELNGQRRAFLYTPAHVVDGALVPADVKALGPLHPDDQRTAANSINNRGEISGWGWDVNGKYFTWYYSDLTGMMSLLNGIASSSHKINNNGQILGNLWEPPYTYFRVVPGQPPEYLVNPNGSGVSAWDMNDNGQFAGGTGFAVTSKKGTSMKNRACRHDGIGFLDLGAGDDSLAGGINNHGDVVGTYGNGTGDAFVYLDGLAQLVNLDAAVVGDAGDVALWLVSGKRPDAININDAGQIAGAAHGTTWFGYLLTPVPAGN